jgi:hypothetical protein
MDIDLERYMKSGGVIYITSWNLLWDIKENEDESQ